MRKLVELWKKDICFAANSEGEASPTMMAQHLYLLMLVRCPIPGLVIYDSAQHFHVKILYIRRD